MFMGKMTGNWEHFVLKHQIWSLWERASQAPVECVDDTLQPMPRKWPCGCEVSQSFGQVRSMF
jgi:hypothetical protein